MSVASTMRCKWKTYAVATTLRLQLERPAASLPAAPSIMFFVAMFVPDSIYWTTVCHGPEQENFPVWIIQRLAEGAKDEAN